MKYRGAACDLRTGLPYARLTECQAQFARAIGEELDIEGRQVIVTAGATGAIEAIRNHVRACSASSHPIAFSACPEYWRAQESLRGLGFSLVHQPATDQNFGIDDAAMIRRAGEIRPDLTYLSLPNNPTGATFDPAGFIDHIDTGAIVFDVTLPRLDLSLWQVLRALYARCGGHPRVFIVASTSKSHGTATSRIGWVLCADRAVAAQLHEENRNAVSIAAVRVGLQCIGRRHVETDRKLARSHALLQSGEGRGCYRIVRPLERVESAYVLIEVTSDPIALKNRLRAAGVSVMWGTELGLSDEFIRLEMLEPRHVTTFIEILHDASPRGRGIGSGAPTERVGASFQGAGREP